jgi:hypothetical protein
MPYLLRKLPLHDRFSTVEVQGGRYRVCPFQILVWVSLGSMGSRELAPQALRFPAVLDTAFTDNFLIHRQQLRQWAGLQQEHLRRFGADLRAHGRQSPLYAANLWIHANVPVQRDRFADHTPFLTELTGVSVSVRMRMAIHVCLCWAQGPSANDNSNCPSITAAAKFGCALRKGFGSLVGDHSM